MKVESTRLNDELMLKWKKAGRELEFPSVSGLSAFWMVVPFTAEQIAGRGRGPVQQSICRLLSGGCGPTERCPPWTCQLCVLQARTCPERSGEGHKKGKPFLGAGPAWDNSVEHARLPPLIFSWCFSQRLGSSSLSPQILPSLQPPSQPMTSWRRGGQ